MTNPPLTVAEAMKALHCSRTFLYSLLAAGELRRIKLGRKTMIPAEDVERLLAEGTSADYVAAS